ncbi:MAG: 3-methyl-2-oxobutanoate hydroxymethyltransferase [Acidibacillus sp.]|uniref:3-methyl-2-oxobutanoate hydroxymethyltransferase n=1 Tax=Sulfoacidibacillus ferrooxidans TaxID=2005001 RepID=A0A9X1VAG4_9BACL|nr:3-methyl-2-oxobutanoate hydroxymethyltransferase [Sulfoacidibacillus ferrooxidans]MCY0894532.1 3-methyl-2-oxobutanoate hydroxymethyltransferase [Acidibacillus sp.]
MDKEARFKQTTRSVQVMKERSEPIVMVTAYDSTQAAHAQAAGVDMILVGDSLGMVMLGYDTTVPVTIEDMIHHAKAVRRGAKDTMVIVDMPFATYHQSVADTVRYASRIMQESYVDGLKLEGGIEIVPHVQALVQAGIPVCGHLGLTPQSVLQFGGFRVQARELHAAQKLLNDAIALQAAGSFMVVLECIPSALGTLVTETITIPTIGIGAGDACSGQVLVYHDLLGLGVDSRRAKFVKTYAQLGESAIAAIKSYRDEVKQHEFPNQEYRYDIAVEAISSVKKHVQEEEKA